MKKNKGKVIEAFEEEALKVDFKLNGLSKLTGIPIEAFGVHSYRVFIEIPQISEQSKLPKIVHSDDK